MRAFNRLICFSLASFAIAVEACAIDQPGAEQPASNTEVQTPIRQMSPPYENRSKLDSEVVAPFRLTGPWIAVDEVYVNGEGPFTFTFDTGGSGGGRADVTLAETLDLALKGEVTGSDGSGRRGETMKRYTFDTLEFAGISFSDVPVASRDYNSPRAVEVRGERIDGILGMGLFSELLLTIDYPNRELRISERALGANDSVPYADRQSPIPNMHVAVNGDVYTARIDTGSMGAITLGGDVIQNAEWKTEPVEIGMVRTVAGPSPVKRAMLSGSIKIGGVTLHDPEVDIIEAFDGVNIGGRFIRDYVLTIDQRNRRIRITASQ